MTLNDRLNLDVNTPDKVSRVLREAADAYYEANSELAKIEGRAK